MKTLTALMTGATLIALTPAIVAADDSAMSFPVHDIIVNSSLPALNISVRNQSQSTNPSQRNLRVVSQRPVVSVAGQVWCKSFPNAETRADAARVVFGNGGLASSPGGADFVGGWSSSPLVELGGNEEVRNYTINAPANFPDHWTGGFITLGLNPVREVEERLQHFVQNGAGSEADFLRVDDVFETTIRVSVVGWCEYESQNLDGRYAGFRQFDVPVHIFYHGDPDIEDALVSVGSPGAVQAPTPGPGPSFAPAQPPPRATPPARRTPPARGRDTGTRQPPGGVAAAALPAVTKRVQRVQQRAWPQARRQVEPQVQQPDPGSASQGGVSVASGDLNGDAPVALLVPAVQKMQQPPAAATDAPGCTGLGATLRREAARAVIGMLRGSGQTRRDPDRPTIGDRLADSAIEQAAGCRPEDQPED